MTLDKLDLGIITAILRTHAELSDLNIHKALQEHVPDDIKITDLEEDRDILNEIADKCHAMIATAPQEA